MSSEIARLPQYRATMEQLERMKRINAEGTEYWLAREVYPILGYASWQQFESLMERARENLRTNGIDPSHHFMPVHKLVGIGSGAQRQIENHFLSRAACYLIAMNGDPTKPEIAAAQAYFVVQTRRQELEDEDEKRLRLREKVSQAHRVVSGVAQESGVRSHMQGVFHDARVQGLYGMSLRDLKVTKGLGEREQLFDRAGALELSANEFQMNLAAAVISDEKIKGEQKAISKNREVAKNVRQAMADSGKMMPEKLPLERPIKELKKKLADRGGS
jgi:DNA-damage-inducible protein D